MDWEQLGEKYDKKHVLLWMRKFPDQIIEAVYWGKKFKPRKKKVGKIVACGMGGSGIGAAIARNLLKEELKVPFETFNSYKLPAYVDSKTLVFCVSFSGNTEETIACFKEAKKKKAYAIGIATGGKMRKLAGRDCIVVPKSSPQPKMAIAYLCLPILVVLEKMGLVGKKDKELGEAVYLLKKEQFHLDQKAKELAVAMKNRLPIIYAPEELASAAYRFRTELNENAKQFALSNFVPEQNHNEINAVFGLGKKSCGIFLLRHEGESERTAKRFSLMKKLMGKRFKIADVNLKGKSLIAVTFYALALAELASYYLALLNRIDPEETPLIPLLKKELKK